MQSDRCVIILENLNKRIVKNESNQKSIKKNFMYYTLLKILNIIFPLITFPYVARVLSAEGIGKVNFSLSVINYFILISQAGIPTYAIRECAKYRDDKDKLSKTVQEILILNSITVLIAFFLLIVIINNVETLFNYKKILLMMSLNILSVNIGIEWLYQAIEEYRYITIRSCIVKLIALIAVFLFIREENDFFLYGLITILSVSLGYFFNFIHAKKYIYILKKYPFYDFKKHIRPIILLFAMSLSISIYVNLDKVMLGFISGNKSVGLYTTANKMVKVILALVTSLGTVLLPRMSYYIEKKSKQEINKLISKSLDFILMISIPASIGIIMLAKPIILVLAGWDYVDAIITIKIISPIIVAIGLSNLIGIQILVSHGKEKLTLISIIIGAVINFTLNLILIPMFHQNGAAIGTLIAEIVVTLAQLLLSFQYIKGNINYKNIVSYLIGALLIVITSIAISYISSGFIITTVLSVFLSVGIYFVFLYLIKNEIVCEITNKLKAKIIR